MDEYCLTIFVPHMATVSLSLDGMTWESGVSTLVFARSTRSSDCASGVQTQRNSHFYNKHLRFERKKNSEKSTSTILVLLSDHIASNEHRLLSPTSLVRHERRSIINFIDRKCLFFPYSMENRLAASCHYSSDEEKTKTSRSSTPGHDGFLRQTCICKQEIHDRFRTVMFCLTEWRF